MTFSLETSLFENPYITFKVGFKEGVDDIKQFVFQMACKILKLACIL